MATDTRRIFHLSDIHFGLENTRALDWVKQEIAEKQPDAVAITGDLTMNGVTKPVVLDAVLNQMGEHPQAKKPWAGFNAVTTIKRSDWNLGKFAPYVSDEVKLEISVEMEKAA